jgi:hypothetical protein
MPNCDHRWTLGKTQRVPFWMPPNSEGLVLNSVRLVEHLKCETCGDEKKDTYFYSEDIPVLMEATNAR